MTKPDPETYTEEETQRRADAALKRMLATPHEKHKPLGVRAKGASGTSGKDRS